MRNLKYLAIFVGITLFAGLVALVLAANPFVALFGKLALAAAGIGFAASATTYVMDQSVAALAIRNKDFHCY